MKDLKLYTYERTDISPKKSTIGFIAQEVESVFPGAVRREAYGTYTDFATLDKDQIYMIHYGTTQELLRRVDALEAENKELRRLIVKIAENTGITLA